MYFICYYALHINVKEKKMLKYSSVSFNLNQIVIFSLCYLYLHFIYATFHMKSMIYECNAQSD